MSKGSGVSNEKRVSAEQTVCDFKETRGQRDDQEIQVRQRVRGLIQTKCQQSQIKKGSRVSSQTRVSSQQEVRGHNYVN